MKNKTCRFSVFPALENIVLPVPVVGVDTAPLYLLLDYQVQSYRVINGWEAWDCSAYDQGSKCSHANTYAHNPSLTHTHTKKKKTTKLGFDRKHVLGHPGLISL